MIRKLYPYGKKKAFNITYDDGVFQDIRFVQLLNRYGLKGTFNLNSGLSESGFVWTHESGRVIRRLPPDALVSLYAGHEVASHTLMHRYMDSLSKEEILQELWQDKQNLEALFGREVNGFAVPFYYYSDLIAQCVKECGFTYARISEESYSFAPQNDFYNWKATVFHCCDDLEGWAQRFLATDEELACFQIVGHAYDLDTENMWDLMERLLAGIAGREDVLPMTTLEIITYLKAMNNAEITSRYIHNRSDISLWFSIHGCVWEVKPHEKVSLETS